MDIASLSTQMNRYKASSLHFLGSAFVLSLVFFFARWVWYPGPLFNVASGAELLKIVILVDLILGPLIMLIIFNPQKASLKFDIACILVCQIAFMLYGAWSIFSARPVYVAFVENRFHVVTANEIDPNDQEKANNPTYQSLPLLGPMIVGTRQPQDQKVRKDILFAGTLGMGLQHLPEYFISYADVMQAARSEGKAVNELKSMDREDLNRLMAYEVEQRTKGKEILFLPLLNKKKILYVALDRSSGAVIEIL